MGSWRRFAPWLAALALAAGCSRQRTVKIALAVPLTGDIGSEGQGLRRAVEMAVEEANAAHRFPFRLAMDEFDDRSDPREAVNVANLIISDPRIVAVIGPYNSGCAIEAAKVYAAAPVAMITPAATNPEVTLQQFSPDWRGPRVVFRAVPTDDVQAGYAADFAYRRLRSHRVAVIHDSTPYGTGLVARFSKDFSAAGGKVVAALRIDPFTRDFAPVVAKLKAAAPDAVYFGGVYTEAGLLLSQMRAAGLKKTSFLAGDGAKTPGLFEVAGAAADGAYVTALSVPVELIPEAKGFIARYKTRWPGEAPRTYDHIGYEAAQILFDALASAGPDRVKLLDALRRVRHRGLLGVTSFDYKGDARDKQVLMMRADARGRRFVPVL